MAEAFPQQLLSDLDLMMAQLIEHYRKPEASDESEQLRQHFEITAELDKLYAQRQAEVKETIRAWSDICQQLKVEASVDNTNEYNASYEVLSLEEKELKDRILSYEQEIERSKDNLTKYKTESAEVDRRIQELDRVSSVDVPRLQKALGLYRTISGVVWDYNSDSVKGSINLKKVFPFDYDQNRDNFEITQNLWDLIDKASY